MIRKWRLTPIQHLVQFTGDKVVNQCVNHTQTVHVKNEQMNVLYCFKP